MLTTAQYTTWLLGIVILTFAAGCSVGSTFRRTRISTKASNAQSRKR